MSLRQDSVVVSELLKPFSTFLQDGTLFEIIVNRPGQVLTEGLGGWRTHEMPELSFEKLMRLTRAVASFSNQSIDEKHPILSAALPGGERIQIVIPPATIKDSVSITIRKPSSIDFSLDDLEDKGFFQGACAAKSISSPQDEELSETYRSGRFKDFLRQAVIARKNIIISGATGSAKTTLSKALIKHIPENERVISIEDTPELVIPQPNHVRLFYSKGGQGLSSAGPKELLESCLRMRPDRIMLQELRDGTAFYYIRNVNSGHPGSITTIHANSAELAFEQLVLLVKESEGGAGLDRADIFAFLKASIDIVAQCRRDKGEFRLSEVYFRGAPRAKD
ncbi:P-type DNA transfer ATPase VirB11 [Rhizobium pusense]|uniref:Type IV secretion system protein n=2 Tax=Agrobacterium TaxID=357 RepID=A0A9W5B7M9_9HYPH|nr:MULTISPECIES: P-type DNA transfer ATPase VirB11 [Agrobacterium]MDH0912944.1 P-type DNA transfer ATPase VirB11 [Agrobacterium pusense]MDH1099226.1 P-type DNA transfer ATPase VirB11 [Agrobacterium pusense]MDH1115763.1 P-type DNA transfer ATPase VirB11 [Agrobacterium pusense]MDH2197526.1 P-type DNA transfer ATPase VirB11 [Agrobacterium pusense]OJH55724.1 type IV secretion system protein VirB11 [Agrobacterium pusense]